MNKQEREMRQLLKRYPAVRLELAGKSGFVLVRGDGQRMSLGGLRGNHSSETRRIEQFCQGKNYGTGR